MSDRGPPGSGRRGDVGPTERVDHGESVGVVGLGRVGSSLATTFAAAGHEVVGYDTDPERVATLEAQGPNESIRMAVSGDRSDAPDGEDADGLPEPRYTVDPRSIRESDYVFVAVPTPVTDAGEPDLSAVAAAGETVGRRMGPATTVVLTSTVYPGGTEEVMLPALEVASGRTAGESFAVGFSPERLDPGDPRHGTSDVTRVVSARDPAVVAELAALFETAVDATVYRAPSIRIAEAAKCIENVQRDVNIALANELAIALDGMGIDSDAVFATARTKWNFQDVRPGLVGGNCVPVDPYHFIHAAIRHGVDPELMLTARCRNELMPKYAVASTVEALRARDTGSVAGARLLLLGLAYKPGVGDIASTALRDLVDGLREHGIDLSGYDPHADPDAAREALGIEVLAEPSLEGFDGVLVATGHPEFDALDAETIRSELADQPVVVDLTGVLDRDALAGTDVIYGGI